MLSVFERRGIGRRRVHTCRSEDDENRDNATADDKQGQKRHNKAVACGVVGCAVRRFVLYPIGFAAASWLSPPNGGSQSAHGP